MQKSLKILITILIIAILGVGAYFAYTKGVFDGALGKSVGHNVEQNNKLENEVAVKAEEPMTVEQIDEIVKSLDGIKDYSTKILTSGDIWDYQPTYANIEATGYIKDGNIYKISVNSSINYDINDIDYYFNNGKLIYLYAERFSYENLNMGPELRDSVKYYFNNNFLIDSKEIEQSKWSTYDKDKNDLIKFYLEDYKEYLEKFNKIKDSKAISNQIIHPLCFGEGWGINENIDIEKCNKEFEKIEINNDNGRIGSSYSINDDGEKTPYANVSYRILSEKDNILVIAHIDSGGGSSTMYSILVYEKNGNILKLRDTVHNGDTDIMSWSSDGKTISYSVNLSGEDLVKVTYPNLSKEFEFGFLEWHFPSYAKGEYVYNIATKENKLLSVYFTNDPKKNYFGGDAQEVDHNSECFQKLYHSYIPKGKDQAELSLSQVNDFNKKYTNDCLDNSILEGEWYVDGGYVNYPAYEWDNKVLKIKKNKLTFDFDSIPSIKNIVKERTCTILNLHNPEKTKDYDGDGNDAFKYKTDCKNHPFSEFYAIDDYFLEISWRVVDPKIEPDMTKFYFKRSN